MDGLYIMENPITMDDLGVPPFQETPQMELGLFTSLLPTPTSPNGPAPNFCSAPGLPTSPKLAISRGCCGRISLRWQEPSKNSKVQNS